MTNSNQSTVFVLHTSFALVDVLAPLFRNELPTARIVNIVDDSLLADVRAANGMTAAVARRIVGYGLLAQSAPDPIRATALPSEVAGGR